MIILNSFVLNNDEEKSKFGNIWKLICVGNWHLMGGFIGNFKNQIQELIIAVGEINFPKYQLILYSVQ